MSVVTRSRRMFSSRVTQFTVMSGWALVNSLVRPCMRIMSPLFTVAMVIGGGVGRDGEGEGGPRPEQE